MLVRVVHVERCMLVRVVHVRAGQRVACACWAEWCMCVLGECCICILSCAASVSADALCARVVHVAPVILQEAEAKAREGRQPGPGTQAAPRGVLQQEGEVRYIGAMQVKKPRRAVEDQLLLGSDTVTSSGARPEALSHTPESSNALSHGVGRGDGGGGGAGIVCCASSVVHAAATASSAAAAATTVVHIHAHVQ